MLFDTDKEVELLWNGKTDEVESMVLPFQTIEHIDEPRSEEKIESQRTLFDMSGRQKAGEDKEQWTGGYIFENEWQSFRTKKDRSLELTSAFKEASKGKMKIAVKVIDIFGNDTTKVIDVNI